MSEQGVHLLVIGTTKESTAKAGLRVALQSTCRRLYLLFKGGLSWPICQAHDNGLKLQSNAYRS